MTRFSELLIVYLIGREVQRRLTSDIIRSTNVSVHGKYLTPSWRDGVSVSKSSVTLDMVKAGSPSQEIAPYTTRLWRRSDVNPALS